MEKKNSVGRYILVFEPKYAYHQFALNINKEGNVEIAKIKKYTDIVCGTKGEKKVSKSTLSDIDKITTSCYSLSDFFDKYVDKETFSMSRDSLHKIFVGYIYNGKMHTLRCVVGDPLLSEKQKYVNGNQIYDQSEVDTFINLLTDTNSRFMSYIIEARDNKTTDLSINTIDLARDLRITSMMLEKRSDSGVLDGYHHVKDAFIQKMTSYKEFREMFLLKNEYLKKLDDDKKRLTVIRQSVVTSFNNSEPYEQMSFFPDSTEKVKKYNK